MFHFLLIFTTSTSNHVTVSDNNAGTPLFQLASLICFGFYISNEIFIRLLLFSLGTGLGLHQPHLCPCRRYTYTVSRWSFCKRQKEKYVRF